MEIKINWYPARSCWRKSITVNGKEQVKYYQFPQTKAGKEQAIAAYLADKAALGKPFKQKIKEALPPLIDYIKENPHFAGNPDVYRLLRYMLNTAKLPEAQHRRENGLFPSPIHLLEENWGDDNWELNDTIKDFVEKWKTRTGRGQQKDNSIGYYLDLYKRAIQQRNNLKPSSIFARVKNIKCYEQFVDSSKKITGIDNQSVRDFQCYLNNQKISKATKIGYFSAFIQFLVFLEIETDFQRPKELKNRQTFTSEESTRDVRMKKQELLWSRDKFNQIYNCLPDDKKLWILLALNCGFRNVDLSHLKWKNIKGNRLLHQREKLSSHESAPTINYKLWPECVDLLKKLNSKSEYVFLNSRGEPFYKITKVKGVVRPFDGIANWWQKNRINYNLPRLDYLRKTGASFVASKKMSLARVYLAETLDSVEGIHYIFNDGKINQELDELTDEMRKEFL